MKTTVVKSLVLMLQFSFFCMSVVGCSSSNGGPAGTETFILPGGVELEMVTIPAGTFLMGSTNGDPDETPVHAVTISGDFQLGRFEVTKAQWEAVMGTTPWVGLESVLNDPDSPAVHISWNDAQAFIVALNLLTGEAFGLPTEAEWEYACRAGSTTEYSFGDNAANLSAHAWFLDNAQAAGESYAHVVGQLLPNAFGLFDVHGNAREWCEDFYDASYYSVSPNGDPMGPILGSSRVTRGGSWSRPPELCRSALRAEDDPGSTFSGLGFRLAR